MPKTFKLTPINGRKSFGWKCKVIKDWMNSILISYDTTVASYNHETNEIEHNWWYSSTTANHINAFYVYYGFDPMTKQEMIDTATV